MLCLAGRSARRKDMGPAQVTEEPLRIVAIDYWKPADLIVFQFDQGFMNALVGEHNHRAIAAGLEDCGSFQSRIHGPQKIAPGDDPDQLPLPVCNQRCSMP